MPRALYRESDTRIKAGNKNLARYTFAPRSKLISQHNRASGGGGRERDSALAELLALGGGSLEDVEEIDIVPSVLRSLSRGASRREKTARKIQRGFYSMSFMRHYGNRQFSVFSYRNMRPKYLTICLSVTHTHARARSGRKRCLKGAFARLKLSCSWKEMILIMHVLPPRAL
jgi:hypothetical protein